MIVTKRSSEMRHQSSKSIDSHSTKVKSTRGEYLFARKTAFIKLIFAGQIRVIYGVSQVS